MAVIRTGIAVQLVDESVVDEDPVAVESDPVPLFAVELVDDGFDDVFDVEPDDELVEEPPRLSVL